MDFLWDEVWWMETIIAALITALATLVAAYAAFGHKISKQQDTIERLEKNIHEEHGGFSQDHTQMLLQQEKIMSGNNSVMQQSFQNGTRLEKLKDHLLEKEARQEEKYALLNQNQQRMADAVQQGINGYDSIRQELLRLNAENQQLRQEIAVLQQQAQTHTSPKPPTQGRSPGNEPSAFYGDDLER